MKIEVAFKKPHSRIQHAMITYPGNVVALCGRRFGKTDAYVQRILLNMTERPGLYWWVGLSWMSASMKRAWREIRTYVERILTDMGLNPDKYINSSRREMVIPGMGEIWFRTATNPSSMAGEGVRGVVLDEFTLMPEIVWTEYVEACLLDYSGWACFSGVPKGKNWAARLWQNAPNLPGWLAVRASTYDNPYIRREDIDRIRARSNDKLFRQEYLAEIVDDAGGVFKGVVDCATAKERRTPEPWKTYVMGVDWGRTTDSTVFTVIDATDMQQVYLERVHREDFSKQMERMRMLHRIWQPVVIMAEYNQMGGPMIEIGRTMGMPIHAFQTSNSTKAQIIDSLALAFEYRRLSILPDPVQIEQLQAYEMTQLVSGMVRYAAPEGEHDDCVMALAFAYAACSNEFSLREADQKFVEAFAA